MYIEGSKIQSQLVPMVKFAKLTFNDGFPILRLNIFWTFSNRFLTNLTEKSKFAVEQFLLINALIINIAYTSHTFSSDTSCINQMSM